MSLLIRTSLSLALALGVAANVYALDPDRLVTQYALRHWDSTNGLPQNSGISIAQDHDGYIWIGTEEGLVRFDGSRFVVFTPSNVPQMVARVITSVAVDGGGDLWMATSSGVLRKHGDQFIAYTARDGLGCDGNIPSMVFDGTSMWAVCRGAASRFDGSRFLMLDASAGAEIPKHLFPVANDLAVAEFSDGLTPLRRLADRSRPRDPGPPSPIERACGDRHGNLWFKTAAGFYRWSAGKMERLELPELADALVTVMLSDSNGNVWIGTRNAGLYRLNGDRLDHMGEAEGLPDAWITTIFEDRDHVLWIGMHTGGVVQLRDSLVTPFGTPEGVAASVLSLREGGGRIIAATTKGLVYREGSGVFRELAVEPSLGQSGPEAIAVEGDGTIWVAMDKGIAAIRNGRASIQTTRDGILSDDVARAEFDRDGTLWLVTTGGIMRRANGRFEPAALPPGPIPGFPRIVAAGPDGSMYFAVKRRSLLKYHHGVLTETRLPASFPDLPILSILPERDGTVWLTAWAAGVFRLRNGRLSSITMANGMPDDGLFALIDDHHGYIWGTSNRGIFGFRRDELEAVADGRLKTIQPISIGSADGMRSVECNGGPASSGFLASDGTIWVPTTKGAVQFDPVAAVRRRTEPGPIIEGVRVDGRALSWNESVIRAGTERVELSYTAIHYADPDALRFRYMLEGFDDHWVDAGSRRIAQYTRLPPGRYRFRVMASVNGGPWAGGAGRKIEQRPHFYQTTWFTSVVVVLIVALPWLLYFLRVAALRRRQRMLENLVYERTEQLEATSDKNETILQSAAEGIVGIDASNVITFANSAARTTLGWNAEAVGQRLHPLIHPDIPMGDCAICEPSGSGTQTNAALFHSRDGRTIPVDVTSAALRKGFGAVVTFRDASERVAIEQMKDEFVATVSHELRTPLTAIRGSVGLIGHAIKGTVGEKVHRLVEIATSNCDRLLRMVNELLDSERLVSGRIELRVDRLDVAAVMNQAMALMQPIGEKDDVHVLAEPFSLTIEADGDRIIQVLTNLIGNAVKFSPRGGSVRLTGEVRGEEVLFHVADEGRGIPKEKLQTVFERFRQVDSSDAHEKGGSGLGLAICRGIVEAHRGHIWVDSELGAGSTFSFSIPIGLPSVTCATGAQIQTAVS